MTVSVQLAAHTGAVETWNAWAVGLLLPLFGIMVLPVKIDGTPLARKRAFSAGLIFIGLLSMSLVTACAGSSSPAPPQPPPQPMTYTINVTATSGGASHSTALTLTVQ